MFSKDGLSAAINPQMAAETDRCPHCGNSYTLGSAHIETCIDNPKNQ